VDVFASYDAMNALQITNFVREHYAHRISPGNVETLGMAGGLSGARFWRISSPRDTFILRRWPVEHPSKERLAWIHGLLEHVHREGFRIVPVPLKTELGESFIEREGHLWELAPWLPGDADCHNSRSPEKLRAAMVALARFHRAAASLPTAATSTTSAVQKRLQRLRELSPAEVATLEDVIEPTIWPDLAALARAAMKRLPTAIAEAKAKLTPFESVNFPLQPCIRDIWHDHVLFTGYEVTGLIDFGAAGVDMPAGDVARLLGSLANDDRDLWQVGLDAYRSVRPLSPEERTAIPALDAAATVIALTNWIRWIYVERRQFDNHVQVISRIKSLVKRLESLRN
jgi:Ser/Thr protein kinase RdoA (MazF antagonist)